MVHFIKTDAILNRAALWLYKGLQILHKSILRERQQCVNLSLQVNTED